MEYSNQSPSQWDGQIQCLYSITILYSSYSQRYQTLWYSISIMCLLETLQKDTSKLMEQRSTSQKILEYDNSSRSIFRMLIVLSNASSIVAEHLVDTNQPYIQKILLLLDTTIYHKNGSLTQNISIKSLSGNYTKMFLRFIPSQVQLECITYLFSILQNIPNP